MPFFIAPDWREAANYPDAKIKSPTRWAWEFLRRNEAYGSDWDIYVAQMEKVIANDQSLKRWFEWMVTRDHKIWEKLESKFPDKKQFRAEFDRAMVAMSQDDLMWTFDPPMQGSEKLPEYKKRVSNYTRVPIGLKIARKWGLNDIANPLVDDIEMHFNGFAKSAGKTSFLNLDQRSIFSDV